MQSTVLLHVMRSILGAALGFVLIISGTFIAFQWSTLLDHFISKELSLSESSMSFENWKETPVPMYIDIYFHNWTNPRDIRMQKPRFSQLGPYRFYEKRTKVDLVWNENNTVSYRQTRIWYFDQENSNGSLSDIVSTVNVVALTSSYTSRFKDFVEKKTVSYSHLAFRQGLAVRKTVEELLFDGYKDDLLTIARYLPEKLRNGAKVADKFGWFYKRNGSAEQDGVFNMATGKGDMSKVGDILSWNYVNQTKYFDNECGAVHGSSGELFPPGISTSSRLALFSPDLCRPIYLNYKEKESVYGIPGLKFTGGEEMFDSGTLNPENKCYCRGECSAPWGLLNVTACRFGVPIFVSYPHFYNADPQLVEQVDGMQPDPEKHSFQLTVEPNYGFPMDLKARFQLNLMIEPIEDISLYSDLPKRLFMPVFWFDQRARLTSELSVKVWAVVLAPYLGYTFAAILVLSGMLVAFSNLIKLRRQRNKIAEQIKEATRL